MDVDAPKAGAGAQVESEKHDEPPKGSSEGGTSPESHKEPVTAPAKEAKADAAAAPSKEPKAKKKPAKEKGAEEGAVEREDEGKAEKAETKPKPPPPKKEKKEGRRRDAEEEGQEAEDDSSVKTPELEAPLILEGKRQRKTVERLASEMITPPAKELGVPRGSGTKLGDVPFIDHVLTKTDADDLKPMHRLCYGRAGTAHEVRRNLRQFCGFEFSKGSKEYDHKRHLLDGWTVKHLKKTCEVLGLERGGQKEKLAEEILDFLLKPKDLEKKVPKAAPAARTKGKKRSRNRGGKKGSSEESDEKGGSERADEEDIEPKKKKAKTVTTTTPKAKASPQKPSGKKGKPAGTPTKTAAKAGKNGPSNGDIEKVVKEILKDADLDKVTMKEVVKKVSAKFPDHDLSLKKDFIKNTVKAMISAAD